MPIPYGFLITFACLYLAEKAREKYDLPFYKAALIYVAPMIVIHFGMPIITQLIVSGASSSSATASLSALASWQFYGFWLAQAVVATITLFFLEKYEDTIAMWLAVLIGGFLVLEYVL